MKKKLTAQTSSKRRIGALVTIAAVATGTYFLISSGSGKPFPVPAYSVLRVIDGDTFVTTEKQNIRVGSTNAPELDQCGGPEAKRALEKLVLGKPVYLKITYRDPFQRFVSFVYTPDGFVNEEMLKDGHSYIANGSADFTEVFAKASDAARKKKLGIFSDSCTQMTNKAKPSCNIKGNTRNGNIYFMPDCGRYNNVEVQLYLGDRWFCSEREAINAGFRRPSQCS